MFSGSQWDTKSYMYKFMCFCDKRDLSQYCSWLSDLKSRQREGGSSAWEEARRATGDRSVDTEILRTEKCGLSTSCRHWSNTREFITFWPNKNKLSKKQYLPSAQVQGRKIPTDMLDAPWCSHGEFPLKDQLQGFTNPTPTSSATEEWVVLLHTSALESRAKGFPALKLTYLGHVFNLLIYHWWLSLQ